MPTKVHSSSWNRISIYLYLYRYKQAIDYYVILLEPIKAISDYLCYTKYRSLETSQRNLEMT